MDGISVIVTVHNSASTIEPALRSVEEALAIFRQGHGKPSTPPSEVLVVDGGAVLVLA